MHLADVLITSIVWGVMWAASSGVATHSVKKIRTELDERTEFGEIKRCGLEKPFVLQGCPICSKR